MNPSSMPKVPTQRALRHLGVAHRRRRRAVALITVLSVLALILVLLTALLSATRVEFNSTVAQVEGATQPLATGSR